MDGMPPQKPMAFAWYATKPHRRWAVLAMAAVIVASTLDGLTNITLKKLIDSIAVPLADGSRDFSQLWFWIIMYILIGAGAGLCWRASGFTGMQWVARTKAYAYSRLFRYLTNHSAGYFSNRFAGALTNNISNAAEGVSHCIENILWQFLPLIITFVVGLYIAATANLIFSLILAVWFVLFIAINVWLVLRKQQYSVAFAEATSRMRGAMVDSATNIAAVHQSGHQEYEITYLDSHIGRYRASNVKNWFHSEIILLSSNGLQVLFSIAMLGGAVLLLQRDLITVGDVTMIISFSVQLMRQVFFIGSEMNRFMDDYGQASEGLQELLMPHDIVDQKRASGLKVSKGVIEFVNVQFSYDEQKVFRNFTLRIADGQKVGLVGHSGAGKTTLTGILLRQYDIQKGDILIDGQSIKKVKQKSIRHHIAIVPQDTSLFHRSIKENIRYGRLDATDEEVIHAAKLAQAEHFILSLPKNYDTLVGERGIKLSGGQRQRIAIARAILKRAPILVLDEATSSLDSESEAAIQQALKALMKGKTVLAIAHRLSTLRAMDRIIVLHEGKIAEDGTHEELLHKKGIYARLWASQVRGFIQ